MNKIPGADSTATTSSAEPKSYWIKLAQDAFKKSTTYMENNYSKQWEDGIRMFNSKHPRDSKYNSESFKYRSRIFRPKSRSVVRKHEATAAVAFFSNPNTVNVEPNNPNDDAQVASAAVMQELLQYRLTKSIPWFSTVIGGFQDAMTVGLVASFQYWDYRTKKQEVQKKANLPGIGPITFMTEEDVPVVDKPCCHLIPIDNIRFDPASHWYNIVETSPYVIVQMPMYVRDVLTRMEGNGGYGGDSWKRLSEQIVLSARITEPNPIRTARDSNREDAQTQTSDINEFDLVMVHLNFIKNEDEIWTYYTLKDEHLLSEPKPIAEVFLHGEIPVTIGFCILETHKAVPNALIKLGQDLQQEANEVANQRLDNVKFVLNKRWFVRRGANVDVESMLKNVPGGVSMVNDVEKDVREVNWQDVTSSAYAEQDRINVDFDELLGNFAQSSVMTNRKMNETVGGMKIMAAGANAVTEYTIKTLVETWVEPTLRQLVKLEQYYETDETILSLAGDKAKLFQKFGMDKPTDALLKQDLTLTVNIGMGATDPDSRFQRFMQATGAYAKIAMEGSPDFNLPEIRMELYGLAGFKDAKRYFTDVDPRLVQAQKMMQAAEGKTKEMIDMAKDRIMRRERQLDNREHDMNVKLIEDKVTNGQDAKKIAAEVEAVRTELSLSVADHNNKLRMDMEAFRQEMMQDRDQHTLDMSIQKDKAKQAAMIKEYEARLDAKLKVFAAKVDAAVKAATADRETTLEYDAAGEPVKSISRVRIPTATMQ